MSQINFLDEFVNILTDDELYEMIEVIFAADIYLCNKNQKIPEKANKICSVFMKEYEFRKLKK